MTTDKPTCAKAPCKTCPYRKDVPSGIWVQEEYDKLPAFDGEIVDQLFHDAIGLFMCHQQDGQLCAGWVGCHGTDNLLALRINAVDPSVWGYKSPVPLFASGAEARAHGIRDIDAPGAAAHRKMDQLMRQRARQRKQKKNAT